MSCSAKGCTGACPMCKLDHMRGLTRTVSGGLDDSNVEEVSLCPGARVYSITIVVRHPGGELGIPDIGAILHLQDSEIEVPMYDCTSTSWAADLPGLLWPQFARFEVALGAVATIILVYGVCAT